MARLLGFKFVRKELGNLRNWSHLSRSNTAKLYVQEMTEDRKAFDNVYPFIVKTIFKQDYNTSDAVKKEISEMLNYNVRHGRNYAGLANGMLYKLLNDPQSITEEKWKLVQVMGWCIEMLYSSFFIVDDALDNSPTRHGKPCWPVKKGVATAMLDTMLMKDALYKLLNAYFKDQPYYTSIIDLFQEVSWKSAYGQSLELHSSIHEATQKFNTCQEDSYVKLVNYKTGYLAFYLPTFAAIYMSEITDSKTLEQTKEILLQLGCYWQAMNDYQDVFEDPKNTGKVGTDIPKGRCSWLLVNAVKKCNKKQLQVLKENYGCDDPTKIQQVVDLYHELDIPKMYKKYSGEMEYRIMEAVDKSYITLPNSIFEYLMARLNEQKYSRGTFT